MLKGQVRKILPLDFSVFKDNLIVYREPID